MISRFRQYITFSIRYVPWFIFKSPQRRFGYFITYKADVAGIFSLISKYLSSSFFNKKKQLQPISICTGLKNRSENYLNYVLASVLQMEHRELIELSIFDCQSSDIPELEKKIMEKWNGKLVFTAEKCDFARAFTFNRAIAQASNELIFAADADMTLPKNLVVQCNKFVSKKTVWFPICFDLNENKPAIISDENGAWRLAGRGMFSAYKWQFYRVGKYDEKFKTWGGEDDDLWKNFYLKGFMPIRNRCKGLFHNYHPGVGMTNQ